MANRPDAILAPESYAELFAEWNRWPDSALFAGGVERLRFQDRRVPELPPVILSLEKVEETHRITRSERYLEIGAMVKLGRIIELRKFVPCALVHCLRNIAGPQVRNMATIGGNVRLHLDSAAALTALDAQYELRNALASRWVSASRFSPDPGTTATHGTLGARELIGRIRVPLDNWDYSAYRKFAGRNGSTRSAVFLAKPQKNVLGDIRIVCKTDDKIWRDRDGEMLLIGKRLPLTRRIAATFVSRWETFLRGAENVDELSRKELVNFIDLNVADLAE